MFLYAWLLAFAAVLASCGSPTPTVYDVLQLVYQVCSTDEQQREERLTCVSSHMGKEVGAVAERCLSSSGGEGGVGAFCEQLTHVPEWAAKHSAPPPHLTRVMGLAALGRMACVLEKIQRPLPMWKAAFAKCFPEFQSVNSLRKDGTKNKSENSLLAPEQR